MKSSLLSTLHTLAHCQPTGSVAIGCVWGMGVQSGSLSNPERTGEFNSGDYSPKTYTPSELTIHPIQTTSNLDRSTQSGRSRAKPTFT